MNDANDHEPLLHRAIEQLQRVGGEEAPFSRCRQPVEKVGRRFGREILEQARPDIAELR